MKVALYTYNTKPRGGVVHTLALAEALQAKGCSVTVFALGLNGSTEFFRSVSVETKVFPLLPLADEAFEARIIRYIDTYTVGLESYDLSAFDIHHVQDCISSNCLNRLVKLGLVPAFLRTVHHLDDFTTPTLVDCQLHSVMEPKSLITVSETWKEQLEKLYNRSSTVIHNGVDNHFFDEEPTYINLKTTLGLDHKLILLTLGGIEPRKNTIRTLEAFIEVKKQLPQAVLLIVGGATLFDYQHYRIEFDQLMKELPDEVRVDIRIITAPDDATVRQLYRLSDMYLQPSLKEGWGLAVLEAMASGLPVIAANIPVFREFLEHEFNALLADPLDPSNLAEQMLRIVHDSDLSHRMSRQGKRTAAEYTWSEAADQHMSVYRRMIADE